MSLEELKTALPKPDQLSPAEIEAKAESLGVSKSKMGFIQSFMLSIMAGAFISMGAMFFLLIVSDSALPFAAQRLIGGCLFSLGLLLVVVCGAELFTGNTMIVMSAASRKITWLAVLKNWLVVFFGNFVGALIMVGHVPVELPEHERRGGGHCHRERRRWQDDARLAHPVREGHYVQLPGVPCGLDCLWLQNGCRQDARHPASDCRFRCLRLRALRCEHVLLALWYLACLDGHCTCGNRSFYSYVGGRLVELERLCSRQHRRRRAVRGHGLLGGIP